MSRGGYDYAIRHLRALKREGVRIDAWAIEAIERHVRELRSGDFAFPLRPQDAPYYRLREWASSPDRKPAMLAFTEGYERSIATLIEEMLGKSERERAAMLQAIRAAYEHLDTFGAIAGQPDELQSQERVFDLLRPFVCHEAK